MLIRLQRIYNLRSIHAIILSVLDVYWALLCTFILFSGLTYWPRAQCQFLFFPCFSVSRKRNVNRSPNGMKPSEKLFLEGKQYRKLGVHIRKEMREARGRGRAHPPGRALHPRGQPGTLLVHLRYSVGFFWPKKSSVKFQVNWTPFDFPFLRYSKTRKKTETGNGL